MAQINPQYTYDDAGNPVGVFLSIKEWNTLVMESKVEIPDWQKKLIDSRLEEYRSNPNITEDWENILAEMEIEDAECFFNGR